MVRKRAVRRRLLAAVLLLLSIGLLTLYFREADSGAVERAQEQGLRVLAPLQTGTARAVQPLRDSWNWVADLFQAKAENARLKTEVDALRAGVANAQATQAENDQLRALVGMRQHMSSVYPKGVRFVAARVIARSTMTWYSTVTIDAGSGEGVKVHDAAVNGQGLVGRVTSVTTGAAEVTLITDQSSFVDAMVLPERAQGLLAGSVTGDLTLQYVDKSAKVEPGQFVVTSGMRGSIFIPGIPIGTVESVAQQEVELYQNVSVRPFVDFHTLDLVMVVER
ncbi:MAG TPA: rod shape-determining protein MreC [Thermoleophilia bacterium]|nr:rod shape-determining protein MreC [Thermoleophilia bacterium]